ncbi:hypothetical protein F5890DRAFT_1479015, partial [Lentinula detonsa]
MREGFAANGSFTITIPTVVLDNDYQIILFGDSDNIGPLFTIVAPFFLKDGLLIQVTYESMSRNLIALNLLGAVAKMGRNCTHKIYESRERTRRRMKMRNWYRRGTTSLQQRRKKTREPPTPLFDDVDQQPRIARLSVLNRAQQAHKLQDARKNFIARRAVTTASLLRRRVSRRDNEDPQTQDVFVDVLMELDDDRTDGATSELQEDGDHDSTTADNFWEEEDATVEEQLLYFRTKDALQNFELKDYRDRRRKIVVDQERWDEQMPELVQAYLDFSNCRRTGKAFEGSVREKHSMTTWSAF